MFTLVLGGGAAKGYAHIGVLKFLEEKKIKPQLIVGASMGALIGGFYAAGFNAAEIEKIALQITDAKKRWLFPFRPSARGLIHDAHIMEYLKPYFAGKKIEKLPIRYAAVATDLEKNCEIIIDRGNLLKAVRAAISIPGLFIPYSFEGRVLVDGGFVDPVPITAALKLGATKIIAVNVLKRIDYKQRKISTVKSSGRDYTIKDVLTRIVEYTTSQLIVQQAEHLKEGLLININTSEIGLSRFEKAKDAIRLGYRQAKKYSKELSKLFDK